ncbi:MAG: hypothetical protein AAF552_16125, partial [Pseudomonadota bacterium]
LSTPAPSIPSSVGDTLGPQTAAAPTTVNLTVVQGPVITETGEYLHQTLIDYQSQSGANPIPQGSEQYEAIVSDVISRVQVQG